jgi:hypothetical protein
MKDQDKSRFSKLITDVLAFYKQDVSPFAISVWWQACEPFDFEQVSKALSSHAVDPERGQFAPKPADVVKALAGTRTDRARLAWSKAFDAMQRVGAYQSVAFDDAVIHAVIEDLGGWTKVCRSDLNELSYLEHRFCEAYRAYSGRPDMVYPAKLIGEYEAQNRQEGRKVAPPMLIGNPQKARDVLRLGSTAPKTQFTLATDVMPAMQLEGKQA